jgi:prepilin-type N-terminal cleavage/methylation domain-containing protein
MRKPTTQSGFTLIELMIAITLVAAISAGLLTTMRNALLTMQRTQSRLEGNRRALGIQNLIRRQIGGAMPVRGLCGSEGQPLLRDVFSGTATALLLVSNESMEEGSRGYPRVAYYQIRPNQNGTVRLELFEQLFSGPASTIPFCEPDLSLHAPATSAPPLVLLDNLAYCRFVFQNLNQNTLFGSNWMDGWPLPFLPYAVRIEMEPAHDSSVRMPVGTITIPLRISRTPGEPYRDDEY